MIGFDFLNADRRHSHSPHTLTLQLKLDTYTVSFEASRSRQSAISKSVQALSRLTQVWSKLTRVLYICGERIAFSGRKVPSLVLSYYPRTNHLHFMYVIIQEKP